MSTVGLHVASLTLGVPEFLVRDFTSYEFNGRKLQTAAVPNDYSFEMAELQSFRSHLESPFPGNGRTEPPEFVQRYLIYEAQGLCALCRLQKPNYEVAHIQPWAKTRSHSPHNLLRLCLDCHTSHGNNLKLLRGVKEEALRRIQLIGLTPVYDCDPDLKSGEAVYVLNGRALRATAHETKTVATGLLRTKVGSGRCTVQRTDVFEGLDGLEPGETYFLAPHTPGLIVTYKVFDAMRDKKVEVWQQTIGRAESRTQLALNIENPIGLAYGD